MIRSLLVQGSLLATTLLGLGLGAAPAAAQGVASKAGVARDGALHCPNGWRQASRSETRELPSHCYPSYANSPKVYRYQGGSCAAGYGVDNQEWCIEGFVEHAELQRANVIAKADNTDRCPAGFHSYQTKCTSDYDRPATARPKGNGECRAGEIAEWGIWCTSNYQHLSAQQIRGAAIRDYNNIAGYTGYVPRQSPKDDESEVYKAMFGNSTPASTHTATDTVAASDNSATASCGETEVSRTLGSLFGSGVGELARQVGC